MTPVERAAKAVAPIVADLMSYWCDTQWPCKDDCGCRDQSFAIARAVIASLREPTPEMVEAVNEDCRYSDGEIVSETACWQAMIDAALTSSRPAKRGE